MYRKFFTFVPVLFTLSVDVRADLFFDLTQPASDTTSDLFAVDATSFSSKSDVLPSKTTRGVRVLHQEYLEHLDAVPPGQTAGTFSSEKTMALVDGEAVVVDISARGDAQALAAELKTLGMTRIDVFGHMISGTLPIASLPAAEALPNLRFMRLSTPRRNVGAVTSEGDASMRTDVARATFGVDGSGTIVGVLSDSYDCAIGATRDAADDVASGDLPSDVNVLLDITSGCIDEGRAMLQLVHDVAPGAGLAFHTAFTGQAGFAQGILDLADSAKGNADVIVDDIIYYAEPMFMDGIVAQAADSVAAEGVAYFSSAGNNERSSQEDVFRPGNYYAPGAFGGDFFGGTAHDFDPGPGVDEFQKVQLGSFTTVLQWSNPFPSVTGVGIVDPADLDFYIFDEPPTTILASSVGVQDGSQDPIELLQANGGGGTYNIMVVKHSGPDPLRMKRVDFGAAALEHDTQSATCYGHANAEGAIAVGAAAWYDTPEFGTDPPELEDFSSAGGVPILFEANGDPVFVLRRKPEITAPDGTNTTFFGQDIDFDGFPNFFGTSAAAPHAAGLAALMLEASPSASIRLLLTGMQAGAVDILARSNGAPLEAGFDPDSGVGLVQAPEAIAVSDLTTATVGSYDFQPRQGAGISSVPQHFRSISSATDSAEAFAPLHLPAGALVELFELEACDESATDAVDAELLICPRWSEACETISMVSTGIPYATGCTSSSVSIAPFTVDNLNNSYFVSVFDPDLSDVTRWRAARIYWKRQISPAPGTATFGDVPTDSPFFRAIEALVSSGITSGCGGGLYCPTDPVTREQMAVFLAKALGLHFAP